MAKQKIRGLSAALLAQHPNEVAGDSEPRLDTVADPSRQVVQTVKVPPDVFIKLKTVGARERRSSQDIILAALRKYLESYQT